MGPEATLPATLAQAQTTLDALHVPMGVVDARGLLAACNRAWLDAGREHGAGPEQIGVGVAYLAVCEHIWTPPAAIAQDLAMGMHAVLRGERDRYTIEYPCQSDRGSRRCRLHMTGFRLGSEPWLVVEHEDTTTTYRLERRITHLHRLHDLLRSVHEVVARVADWATRLEETCRLAVEQAGFAFAWIERVDPITDQQHWQTSRSTAAAPLPSGTAVSPAGSVIRDLLTSALQSGRPAYRNDLSEVDRKSEARLAPEHASAIVVPLRRGNDVLALALIHDESGFFEEVELDLLDELTAVLSAEFEPLADRKGLEHAVRYDSLTGLLNRQGCIDRLQQQIDLQREVARLELALVDLDRFTWINEMRGRDFGDRLLREIARRLTGSRPPADIVARIGADTFAVGRIYQGSADPTALGNHLLGRINEPVYLDAEEIRLTAHVGVAWFPDDAPDANSLLQSAEAALRQAKTDAQRVVQFAPQLDTRIAERLAIETDLHRALDQQQFILHYQPKLDLASGEVVGAEALIRWQHPQRGLIPPSAFIGIAEDLGLILDLGDWVLETACAQQAAWLAAGLRLVPMTVNVSPIQLLRGDLLSSVRRVLARHGLSPRHLELELTETAALPDLLAAHQTLAGLRKLGVGLSLDDFGTGYASLEQIRRFPIDSVKIDRSFIADVTNQTHNNAIVSAIIAMSHALNLRVIAEGVETEAQLAFLRARGCDEMQGFYFRLPLSAGEFAALLDQPTRARLPDITADSRPTILIVDDDSGVRSALGRVLRRDGCRILSTGDGASALDLLALHEVHVVIADQRMPRMDGAQFLAAVKRLYPDTVRIMLSGFTDLAALTAAINRSAVLKFLTKPWIDDELRAEVRDALRHHRRFCSP